MNSNAIVVRHAGHRRAVGSPLNRGTLRAQNLGFRSTGGTSAGNRQLGFRPAFLDGSTGRIYLARHLDGQPAPFHSLDGLPEPLVVRRLPTGRVVEAQPTLIAGFLKDGRFWTREQAATALAQA
ncbi:MAG: hypothetical protein ACREWG_06260 [Gammaproteobacteria bacterium]